MRPALLALLLATASGAAQASDWTATDTAIEATGAVLHLADWSQTLAIAHNGKPTPFFYTNGKLAYVGSGGSEFEMNPILGSHPGAGTVDLYFGLTLAAHVAVAYALPSGWPRRVWQLAWIGVEGTMVIRNYRGGVSFSLPWE